MKIIRKIYSETKKKSEDGEKQLRDGATIGLGGMVGLTGLQYLSHKDFMNSKITAADEEAVRKALLDKARKQGIKISSINLNNSAYTGGSNGKTVRKGLAALVKKLNKSGQRKKAKDLMEGVKEGSGGLLKHLGKDHIVLGNKENLSSADVLSHELGHAQYLKDGRSKNIIAKGAHKAMIPAKIASSGLGIGLSAVHGFRSGVKSEKLKQEGKNESKWNKVKSVAIPAIAVSPLLIGEGAATIKGLKMMKQVGASKELLKQSRKRLGAAFGTYTGAALKPVVAGEAGRIAGKGYAKMRNKKNKEKE